MMESNPSPPPRGPGCRASKRAPGPELLLLLLLEGHPTTAAWSWGSSTISGACAAGVACTAGAACAVGVAAAAAPLPAFLRFFAVPEVGLAVCCACCGACIAS